MADRRRRDPARTEARRHQILDAAAACFRLRGFRGASMSEISKAAAMSTGHIYHYFASKEAIVEAIVERDQIHGLAIIEQLKSSADVRAIIIEGGVEAMVERPGKTDAALMMEIYAEAARNPLVASIVRNSCDKVRASLLEALRKCQDQGTIDPEADAEDLRRILFIAYDGLTANLALYSDTDKADAKRVVRLMLERVLRPKP